jgi:hypothetical protein
MVMPLHRLYLTLIILHLDVKPLAHRTSICSSVCYNDSGSVPFYGRIPDSGLAHSPSHAFRVVALLQHLTRSASSMHRHAYSTRYVSPSCGMFLGPLHIMFMCYCLYSVTTACERCLQYNDFAPEPTLSLYLSIFTLEPNNAL